MNVQGCVTGAISKIAHPEYPAEGEVGQLIGEEPCMKCHMAWERTWQGRCEDALMA